MTLVPRDVPDVITEDWHRGRGLRARLRRRREIRELDELAARLGWCWEDTVTGAGLVHHSKTAAGIPHTSAPRVQWVEGGPPLTLVVRMLPGQVADDFRAQAHRLAEGMGVAMVRVSTDRHGWLRVALLARDPLTTPMPLPARPRGTSAAVPVLLGADEYGRPVTIDFSERVHLIVQGRTGSGKSRLSYAILQQLAAAPDAVITGCDPSSVLLRPFTGTRHGALQVLGADPLAHAALLDRLVDEMDARLARIPARCDVLPLGPDAPFLFVVLEEWLALLGLAGSDRKLRDRLSTATRRLAAEGGKVGVRVIMLPQRAEANEVGGGLLRGQFAYRLSLPVDNVDAVRLLHPGVSLPQAEAHIRHGQPGVALYDAPDHVSGRLRTPWMPDYGAYWDAITDLTS
ncbi:FtsK/SpoIIIE domain-containing protein [Pseudonocardia hispaniensis]|uniref:FtsK/SpoIIIE domain-containing protein n=1 Tax=Pseudonocardia hispaniensis TaxID=904933 RepID=A0ABW1J788_9PSEU